MEKVILEAWEKVKEDDEEGSFDVVVVDSGPLYEGASDKAPHSRSR